MRTRDILIVMAVCAASGGCSEFLRNSIRNLAEWPIVSIDDHCMKYRNERRADLAWRIIEAGCPKEYTSDYGKGFRAGYADYLTNGGNGEPPAVPPFCYRTTHYQTPAGVEAINQWYAGWKHGALMAKASGQREFELVPLSAPPINAVLPNYDQPIALPSTPDQLPKLPGELPLPRVQPSSKSNAPGQTEWGAARTAAPQ